MNLRKVIENDHEEKLYIAKIDEVMDYLRTYGATTFFDIIRNVGGSERRMLRLLNEMVTDGAIYFKNDKFYINNNGFHDRYMCPTCNGKRVYTEDNLKEELEKIWSQKPIPTLLFDQRPVTLDTTINRVLYMMSRNDVSGKKIVFLGDDDLTSLALGLYNRDADITVLDVDLRLVNFINRISKEYDLNVKAYEYNVMDYLDNKYKNKFDVVMTDPTPEKVPFTIFMNACIHLLRREGIIYTSIYSSAMDRNLDLQKAITEMNLYITEIIPNFTEYQSIYGLFSNNDLELLKKYNIEIDSNSICFTESLFRMIKNNESKPLKINYKLEDIFGKATKRVINDKNKDLDSDEYLDSIYENLSHLDDTIKTSE